MKKKRLFLAAVLSIFILFSVSVNSVNAAEGWYDQCVIISTGTQDGRAIVRLQGGASNLPLNWYMLGQNTTESNQQLAVILMAMSIGVNVGVTVEPYEGYWPVIRAVVISAP